MNSNKELVADFPHLIRVYRDGTVERLLQSSYASPSLENPTNGVSSKDVIISSNISARLYLTKFEPKSTKVPILVYFHGGGFCLGSAFTRSEHNYINTIVSHCNTLTVSVEYRLAPENLLPAAYEDCWAALQWVASHSTTHQENSENLDPWLVEFGDFDRLYTGGDSAGANIVHNIHMQAGKERLNGDVRILGGFLFFPYFWGSKPGLAVDESNYYKWWMLSYPDAPGGIDNPMINPFVGGGALRLVAGLGCKKLLVVVAEKDRLRENGLKYFEAVKESEWDGEIELVDVEGEDHCFQAFDPNCEKAKYLFQHLASFIA